MNDKTIVLDSSNTEELARQHRLAYSIIKRVFDIFIGLIGTILLLPLGIVIKIAYMLDGDFAPILFRQARIGKDGKTIHIYKFRSMVVNADEVLYELMKKDKAIKEEYMLNRKLKNDPRITKVGKLIRHASIDEFPQFINVLFGSMSVVGPRPYLHREQNDMGVFYKKIITCKPGVTGYWQVSGRSNTDFKTRLKMDNFYCENPGLKFDLFIFIKTFATVLGMDGAK